MPIVPQVSGVADGHLVIIYNALGMHFNVKMKFQSQSKS